MKPIRVLLADDHNLVRAGIRTLIENISGIEVIAETGDGREVLRLVGAHRPDLVLMDIGMPGLNGLETTARITKEFPLVRVIMLSMHTNEEYVLQSLRSGAAGYLVKGADTAELEIAIMAVIRGEKYLSPAVSKYIVTDYLRRLEGDGGPFDSFELLTPRQREVLQLIAEGHSTKKIAQILGISVKTVESHRIQLMERLDIHDIAGLVRYAIRTGLTDENK
ncbi:MAG TPA: response regulator transcription factor [Thermodesulfobacteriota bacterium]|nr:response regulator transcription factor [Thermodesulfobacteriota bacterium]